MRLRTRPARLRSDQSVRDPEMQDLLPPGGVQVRESLQQRLGVKFAMTHTLRRLLKIAVIASCAFVFAAIPAKAQFTGVTTVQQTLGTNVSCTGSAQTFPVSNLGQIRHVATISAINGGVGAVLMEIDGLDTQGNTFRLSDVAAPAGQTAGPNLNSGSVMGYGYFPQVKVQVTCPSATGTFTLSYSGDFGAPTGGAGSYQFTQTVKELWLGQSLTGGPTTPVIQTPFGNSQGLINLKFNGGGTLSLTLNCTSPSFNNNTTFVYNFTAQNLTNQVQTFPIPASPCPLVSVTSSALSGQSISLEYVFTQPGLLAPQPYVYSHVGNTTATSVKAVAGVLHTINVNSGNASASTLSIFDLAGASCTGTPASNTVAVIQVPASINALPTFTYDTNFVNGICVKASATMDVTASYQ